MIIYSIFLDLRDAGYSNKDIATALEIPQDRVNAEITRITSARQGKKHNLTIKFI